MNLFGMVTTRTSERFTEFALKSFDKYTALQPGDRAVLIANDGDYRGELPIGWELRRPESPQSFAANVNMLLREAGSSGANLFFLNNDLIFTPRWLEPLAVELDSLLSPLSNAEVQYRTERFACRFAMDLDDYLGHEAEVERIALANRERHSGYSRVFTVPFFCVKLPHRVYTKVGLLDESYGKGGGEDKDYCLRAHLAGFSVCYAAQSFLLHFQGQSTWRGAETQDETRQRDAAYMAAFERKWGRSLLRLALLNDFSAAEQDARLKADLKTGAYADIVLRLMKPQA